MLSTAVKTADPSIPVPLDTIDVLSAKLAQLRALLLTVSGAGFSSFSELDLQEQGHVLWLAAELSGEAKDALLDISST
jgi:hypothetical protein